MLLQAAVLAGLLVGGAPGDSPSVTCHVRDDAQGRTFVLEQAAAGPNAVAAVDAGSRIGREVDSPRPARRGAGHC